MGKTVTLLVVVTLLAAAGGAWGQANELLDLLFEEPATTLGQAAYLVLTASGRIPDDSSPDQAAASLSGTPHEPDQSKQTLTAGAAKCMC